MSLLPLLEHPWTTQQATILLELDFLLQKCCALYGENYTGTVLVTCMVVYIPKSTSNTSFISYTASYKQNFSWDVHRWLLGSCWSSNMAAASVARRVKWRHTITLISEVIYGISATNRALGNILRTLHDQLLLSLGLFVQSNLLAVVLNRIPWPGGRSSSVRCFCRVLWYCGHFMAHAWSGSTVLLVSTNQPLSTVGFHCWSTPKARLQRVAMWQSLVRVN